MKATELRIGNYVYRQSDKMIVNRDDIYQIEIVTRQTQSKYDPIPITDEWLKNFRFIEFSYVFNHEVLTGYIPVSCGMPEYNTYIIQKYIDKYYVMINGESKLIISCGFDYVHELQNIYYSLTKRELGSLY